MNVLDLLPPCYNWLGKMSLRLLTLLVGGGCFLSSSTALADETVGVEQVTSSGVLSAKKQQISYTTPFGFGMQFGTELTSRTLLRASYEAVFKNNSALMHGPHLDLGFRIYGNNSFVQTTEVNRVVVKYPLSVTLLSGLFFQFHDFSALLKDTNKIFSGDVPFFKPGLLYGGSVSVVLGLNSTEQLRSHVLLRASYARVPAIDTAATLLCVGLGLGIDYVL